MMKQCKNGHLYDGNRHNKCPYCADNIVSTGDGFINVDPVSYTLEPPRIISDTNTADEIPINYVGGMMNFTETLKRPVGWLVCIDGNEIGLSYELYNDKNIIGKGDSTRLNIKLNFDSSISDGEIVSIIYNERMNKFFVVLCDKKNDVYANNQLVITPMEIKDGDIFKIGKTKMIFRALCNDTFSWKN